MLCKKCGKLHSHSAYCLYCGAKNPAKPLATPPAFNGPKIPNRPEQEKMETILDDTILEEKNNGLNDTNSYVIENQNLKSKKSKVKTVLKSLSLIFLGFLIAFVVLVLLFVFTNGRSAVYEKQNNSTMNLIENECSNSTNLIVKYKGII